MNFSIQHLKFISMCEQKTSFSSINVCSKLIYVLKFALILFFEIMFTINLGVFHSHLHKMNLSYWWTKNPNTHLNNLLSWDFNIMKVFPDISDIISHTQFNKKNSTPIQFLLCMKFFSTIRNFLLYITTETISHNLYQLT